MGVEAQGWAVQGWGAAGSGEQDWAAQDWAARGLVALEAGEASCAHTKVNLVGASARQSPLGGAREARWRVARSAGEGSCGQPGVEGQLQGPPRLAAETPGAGCSRTRACLGGGQPARHRPEPRTNTWPHDQFSQSPSSAQ